MQGLNVFGATVIALGFYGISAFAADSSINLKAAVLNQKVAVHVATANPAVISVKAQGPLDATIKLQHDHSGNCVALVEEIAAGVCVPTGPGGPVSPN